MGIFSGLFNKENSGNSTTTNDTLNVDQKQQLGDGAVGATASGNGMVTINTSDMGAISGAFGAVDSAFMYGNAITDGTLKFANANNDTNAKLVNATVDGAFKAVDSTVTQTTKAMFDTTANAMKLANAATDSALRFGDSTVAQSYNFAEFITQGAANQAAASATRADQLVSDALSSVKSAYGDMSSTLADAYTNSKAGEQKVLVGVAVAILGLVAIKMAR